MKTLTKFVSESTVHELASKHGLTVKDNGKAIHDFNYNDEIGDEFKQHGYTLNWNPKKNHFDVISDRDKEEQRKKEEIEYDRKVRGFNSTGKRRTQMNIGGGYSVNGIKK